MRHEAYLSLGSNMGNREDNLRKALNYISCLENTTLLRVSNIYETDPVGYSEQDRFLNLAAVVDTGLEPLDLLSSLQGIETALKRVRTIRWGPRTIDIDILLFDNRDIKLAELTVPHPRMFERAFVLVPLKEIISIDNIAGNDINEMIDRCSDREGVKLYKCLGDR